MKIAMLGTGLIGTFYTMSLHGLRSRDEVVLVYSRSEERGAKFAKENKLGIISTINNLKGRSDDGLPENYGQERNAHHGTGLATVLRSQTIEKQKTCGLWKNGQWDRRSQR